jgi:hypothetical protein
VGERAASEIRSADVVFCIAGNLFVDWLRALHHDVRDLRTHYRSDLDRRDSYAAMQEAVVAEVCRNRRVVAALYGHGGVFAQLGHAAIASARTEGHRAWMEPGISADACLYADLGLDPGETGVQQFEATQFLIQQRSVDLSAVLVLWQVALAGNIECIGFEPDPGRLALLVEKLTAWYRPEVEVVLYEAATLPIAKFRAEPIRLFELPRARLSTATTLVIPPVAGAPPDIRFREQLESFDRKKRSERRAGSDA